MEEHSTKWCAETKPSKNRTAFGILFGTRILLKKAYHLKITKLDKNPPQLTKKLEGNKNALVKLIKCFNLNKKKLEQKAATTPPHSVNFKKLNQATVFQKL